MYNGVLSYMVKYIIIAVLLMVSGYAKPVFAQTAENLSVALAVASEEKKLVLAHFWNKRCGPCKLQQDRIFSRPEHMTRIEKEFVFVKIDTDDQPLITRLYKITSVPTEVLMLPTGKEISNFHGAPDAGRYIEEALVHKQEFKENIRGSK